MAKIGDQVRYLNSVGGGRIVRIDGQVAYVDEDGFETPVLLRECVVVAAAGDEKLAPKIAVDDSEIDVRPSVPKSKNNDKATMMSEPEETPGGDQLNIVLAYEPRDLRHLSVSDFEAVLVNDSNYYLYYTYMTKADGADGWVTRSAGVLEPAMQLALQTVSREDLPEMDRVALQYVAFKKDRMFALKNPGALEFRLDTTKFARLHCFHDNPYFDGPVIAYDIVKNDVPSRIMSSVDPHAIERAMKEKTSVDRRKPSRPQPARADSAGPLVVDLHIDQLIDTTAGLSNADMLRYQIDEFRKVMDANRRHHGMKIVFIHGKGEGVLRQAVLDDLRRRYPRCQAQDASFREYGFGATQVTVY